MSKTEHAFLTIITRDYYWWAKTWAESVVEHHPDARIYIAFADTPTSEHAEVLSAFDVISVPEISSQLGIENYSRMAFQYTPFELTCSLKPFLMNFLSERFEKVVYLDADTYLYRPFDVGFDALNEAEIVATPHLAQPIEVSQETGIRNAGTLNGGLIATRRGDSSQQFLEWWSERCRHDCCVDPYAGKFVDQSWLDLATRYFDAFRVIRNATINVAYWNIGSRVVTCNDDTFYVNGQPLTLFHFSGHDPDQSEQLSRFEKINIEGDLKRLVRKYQNSLIANRRESLDMIDCEYNRYQDGSLIDPVHREGIRQQHVQLNDVENPFDTTSYPEIRSRLESIREQLILSRKHWQLEELQKLADQQTEWIQKQSKRRLDKKLVQACRRLVGLVKDKWFVTGAARELTSSNEKRKAA